MPAVARAPITPGPVVNFGQHEVQEDKEQYTAPRRGAPLPPRGKPPLKQQIESYFSDEGLKQDAYFRDLIAESPGGWVDVDIILGLRQIKSYRAKRADVLQALHSSWLETYADPDGSSAAVRRPPGRAMPKVTRPQVQPPVASKEEDVETAEDQGGQDNILPGRLTGTVLSFNEDTGDALISCSETEALFQQHVAMDWRELERAGSAVNIGSLVSFCVSLGLQGEPRARELQLEAPEDDDDSEHEAVVASKRRKTDRATQAVVGKRYDGCIKSFHAGIGLGFISCKETHATYGRDVTIDRAEFAKFRVGDKVSFTLAEDPELGTPKATDLDTAVPAVPEAPQGRAAQPGEAPSGRFMGLIIAFNEAIGIGKIVCPDTYAYFHRDVALPKAELAGFGVGDRISFLLTIDPTFGTPSAADLEAE